MWIDVFFHIFFSFVKLDFIWGGGAGKAAYGVVFQAYYGLL